MDDKIIVGCFGKVSVPAVWVERLAKHGLVIVPRRYIAPRSFAFGMLASLVTIVGCLYGVSMYLGIRWQPVAAAWF